MMRCLTMLLKRGDLELEQHSIANTLSTDRAERDF